ncbi:MAG: beta-N-acetylhexosaminidase [Treponema sp.]|nr:beta-N-acetylhexosaminidase [Treponema sp.]
MREQLSIIPKPVSVKYNEGFFKSESLPDIIKKECAQEQFGADTDKVFEAYRLIIEKDRITAEAPADAGMHHCMETFRQLTLSGFKDGVLTLPCAEITDYPRFSWRGFMLDCSRYFYSVLFIKNLLDVLSLHHINRFHWHLTDDQGWRFKVAEYPLLTEIGSLRKNYRIPDLPPSGGFYTEDEIRDVVNYASVRHIEVIPEVDLPGHASAILASYPEFGCTGGPYEVEERFGIFEDVLCAGNDRIFDLAEKVFDTLAGLFPSKWVHIGGDEVLYNRWEACPKCRSRLKELGLKRPAELQSWITFKLVQMLSEKHKTAIGWDEILGTSNETPNHGFGDDSCPDGARQLKLPKEAVVMSWRGDEGGIKAARLGHEVIMSPCTGGCYLDYKQQDSREEPGALYAKASTVLKSYSMDPVPALMNEKDAKYVIGGQGNLWSELIYAGKIAEYMIFPRMCAIAESLWTPKDKKDFDDFSKRLIIHRERLDNLGINQYRGSLC